MVKEYACPVWKGSTHVSKLGPALNEACRSITEYLRPTFADNVYLLAGILLLFAMMKSVVKSFKVPVVEVAELTNREY